MRHKTASYTVQLYYRGECPLAPGDRLAHHIEDGLGNVHFFKGDAIVDFIERQADPLNDLDRIVATVDHYYPIPSVP